MAERSTAVGELLADGCTEADVRRVMDSEDGFDRAVWTRLVDQGVLGMLVGPEFGGLGFGAAEPCGARRPDPSSQPSGNIGSSAPPTGGAAESRWRSRFSFIGKIFSQPEFALIPVDENSWASAEIALAWVPERLGTRHCRGHC